MDGKSLNLRLGLADSLHGVIQILSELAPDSDAKAALQILGRLHLGSQHLPEGLDLLLRLETGAVVVIIVTHNI